MTRGVRTHAAVLREPGAPFTVEEVDLAEPGPGEALVSIAGAGMCHTDFLPRHGMPMRFPVILGHEGAGVVEAVGPGVTAVVPGDHVVLSFDSCGACGRCLDATPSYCDQFFPRNLSGRRLDGSTSVSDVDGQPISARWFGQSAFAAHVIATVRTMVRVDRSLPLATLAPLGCGIQTGAGSVLVGMAVGPGASITVFGTGAVGLAAVMAAKVAGAKEIIAVDLNAERRELALELGATRAVDGADPDVAAVITGWTGGTDFAFDTTGVSDVIVNALATLRPGGTCGLVAVGNEDLVIPARALLAGRVLTYMLEGNVVPQRFIPALIDLWQRNLFPFDRLISEYPLDGINEAEQDARAGKAIKPLLLPTK